MFEPVGHDRYRGLSPRGAEVTAVAESNAAFLRRVFPEHPAVDLDGGGCGSGEAHADDRSAVGVWGDRPGRDTGLVVDDGDDDEAGVEGTSRSTGASAEDGRGGETVNTGTKQTVAVLGGSAGVVAVVLVVLFNVISVGPAPVAPQEPQRRVAVAGPRTSAPAATEVSRDKPMPFEASADCGAGSTTARIVENPTGEQAWVCYGPGLGINQWIDLRFPDDVAVMAITITPGWVAKVVGGKEEYAQHRIVSKIRWWFVGDPQGRYVDQDTKNVRGAAWVAVPGIRTRWIRGVITQTSRPEVKSAATAAPAGGGMWGAVFGGDGSDVSGTVGAAPSPPLSGGGRDPVDESFAVSRIEVIGHVPE